MKRFFILLLALGLTAGTVTVKFRLADAQEAREEEMVTVSGKITAVDLARSTITVQTVTSGNDQEVDTIVISVNGATSIDKSAEAIRLKQLSVGNAVEVEYQVAENGTLIAQHVWVY